MNLSWSFHSWVSLSYQNELYEFGLNDRVRALGGAVVVGRKTLVDKVGRVASEIHSIYNPHSPPIIAALLSLWLVKTKISYVFHSSQRASVRRANPEDTAHSRPGLPATVY